MEALDFVRWQVAREDHLEGHRPVEADLLAWKTTPMPPRRDLAQHLVIAEVTDFLGPGAWYWRTSVPPEPTVSASETCGGTGPIEEAGRACSCSCGAGASSLQGQLPAGRLRSFVEAGPAASRP